MKTINIFDKEVSWFDSIYEKEASNNCYLKDILFDSNEIIETMVDRYRENPSSKAKCELPCFTPSGVFNSRNDNGLVEHSGIICIDIDAKDNSDVENFEEIRELMEYISYVAYCGHSCSAKGYFILIPIAHPQKHREHFTSICDDFERCNITVDRACINVSRTRTVSSDYNPYVNKDATVYTRLKEVQNEYSRKKINSNVENKKELRMITKRKRMVNISRVEDPILYFKVKHVLSWIDKQKIDITKNEPQWHKIGIALADEFGEFGRDLFHEVSKYYPKYSKWETNRKFDRCLTLFGYKIGTFFYYAARNGYKTF